VHLQGGIYIKHNGVQNLKGLEQIQMIEGDLNLEDNVLLSDITALSELGSVGGYVDINSNDSLENLQGLNSLSSIGRSLYLTRSPRLLSVDGLSSLISIGNDLQLDDCALEQVDALSSLESVEEDVIVVYNDHLPQSNIDALIMAIAHIGGNVIVAGNGE
jgi:hypothetical protein